MSIEALSGKVFLLITGASRGIGRQIAITFGSLLDEGSHMLLLARNLNALKEVAKNIPSKITVDTVSVDLSKSSKDDIEAIISKSLKESSNEMFERVVIVHNVGSIGDVSKFTTDLTDLNEWRTYYDMNVFIPIMLNAVVMKMFGNNAECKKVIINITSLFAIKPYCGFVYYSSAKAAREMYFKVFAVEHPHVNVLSYSPGPVDTDMLHTARESTIDAEIKGIYEKLYETETVLTPEQTVNRLVEVLKARKYKSADHVDYYDEL